MSDCRKSSDCPIVDQTRSSKLRFPKPALIRLESFTVYADRIEAQVVLSSEMPHKTSAAIARRVLDAFPNLAHHACVNNAGSTFGDVIAQTSVPHLLEHLVVELQVRAVLRCRKEVENAPARKMLPKSQSEVFVGTTEWVNEEEGRARIEVSFTDDLVALQAFREAVHFLESVVIL